MSITSPYIEYQLDLEWEKFYKLSDKMDNAKLKYSLLLKELEIQNLNMAVIDFNIQMVEDNINKLSIEKEKLDLKNFVLNKDIKNN